MDPMYFWFNEFVFVCAVCLSCSIDWQDTKALFAQLPTLVVTPEDSKEIKEIAMQVLEAPQSFPCMSALPSLHCCCSKKVLPPNPISSARIKEPVVKY